MTYQTAQVEEETKTTPKQKVKGSEAVMKSLMEEGVDLVFGYPGGAIMPVYDAMMDYREEIKHVLTCHEQGAVHAAQGYARVTGKTGVCFVTSGPGATNVVTGIADAMLDSTPLVVISGQVASPLLGTDAFQEIDVIGVTQPITKWNYQIKYASEITEIIAKAFYIANSGRPGPVVIDITKDAQFQMVDFEYKKAVHIRSYQPVPEVKNTSINEAARLINLAKKPMILAGQGIILGKAEEEFRRFVEKTGIPTAWTLLGLSALPTDHPLNVGMLGMHGNYGPNIKTNEADLIIAVGMRFDDRVTGNTQKYGVNAKIIHLEIDKSEISKNIYADVPVVGNVKDTLPLLTQKVVERTHTAWLEEFKASYRVENDKIIRKQLNPVEGKITMGEAVNKISSAFDDDAIMVTDVGQHQMMAARYFRFKQSRSVVTSGGLGTMGFGLPAALGAALGRPDRDVVLFVGDGGIQMTIQELGTIFRTEANVKIVLLNNDFLGMVRQWQELFFDKRYASTIMINPNFQLIAQGYGIEAAIVKERGELDKEIEKMIAHKGPYLLEIKVEKEDNVFPMVPSGASVSEIRLE
jgi:acetolactate synthase-1/2/3 large subunit